MIDEGNRKTTAEKKPQQRGGGLTPAGVLRDLRFGLRQLARSPWFAFVIIFTLAVGIGPNVAISSVLKALVLQDLPYPEPQQLVQVRETDIDGRWRQPFRFLHFGAAALLMMALALVAASLPALRATRVDPIKALRAE